MRLGAGLLLALCSGCVDGSLSEDLFADAGRTSPALASQPTSTEPADGHLIASLTAQRFSGFQSGESQVLEGVRVHFLDSGFKLDTQRARLVGALRTFEPQRQSARSLEQRAGVSAPSVTYSGRTRLLGIDGPVEFYGRGHRIEALGGATANDRFERFKLAGPVRGLARWAR